MDLNLDFYSKDSDSDFNSDLQDSTSLLIICFVFFKFTHLCDIVLQLAENVQ